MKFLPWYPARFFPRFPSILWQFSKTLRKIARSKQACPVVLFQMNANVKKTRWMAVVAPIIMQKKMTMCRNKNLHINPKWKLCPGKSFQHTFYQHHNKCTCRSSNTIPLCLKSQVCGDCFKWCPFDHEKFDQGTTIHTKFNNFLYQVVTRVLGEKEEDSSSFVISTLSTGHTTQY